MVKFKISNLIFRIKHALSDVKINAGFTFLEVVITISLLATILGFTTISLLNVRNKASLSTSLDLLISDIQSQQLKALSANTEGRSTPTNYGIKINSSTSYTLFNGTYSQGGSGNIVVQVENPLRLTTTFPSSQAIFVKSTGELSSFTAGQNTITVQDTSQNVSKTIHINALGVITTVD